MQKKQNKSTKNQSQNNNTGINLPPQDIKTEPGQPTFKQALQTILTKKREFNK